MIYFEANVTTTFSEKPEEASADMHDIYLRGTGHNQEHNQSLSLQDPYNTYQERQSSHHQQGHHQSQQPHIRSAQHQLMEHEAHSQYYPQTTSLGPPVQAIHAQGIHYPLNGERYQEGYPSQLSHSNQLQDQQSHGAFTFHQQAQSAYSPPISGEIFASDNQQFHQHYQNRLGRRITHPQQLINVQEHHIQLPHSQHQPRHQSYGSQLSSSHSGQYQFSLDSEQSQRTDDSGNFTPQDLEILHQLLTPGEKFKWKSITKEINRSSGMEGDESTNKKVSPMFVSKQYQNLFGLPNSTYLGSVGSSLPYMISKNGWNDIDESPASNSSRNT